MKLKVVLIAMGLWILAHHVGWAQQSSVVPWSNPRPNTPSSAYRPEPILFVHGINANDATWTGDAMPLLRSEFLRYDFPRLAIPLTGVFSNMWVAQTNYVHTFNYGDLPGTNTINRQSYEPIMWNAWEHGDMA
jgi:hypothetical protein